MTVWKKKATKSDEWLEWLKDEPPRAKPANPDPAPKRDININVHLRRPNLPKLNLKQRHIAVGAVLLTSLIIVSSVVAITAYKSKKDISATLGAVTNAKPTYKPVLPHGKATDTQSGNYAFDAARNVVSFTDKISTIDVTVSEQPLPANFKSDPDSQVASLAKNLNANEVINESNPKAYIGRSIKGPQTVLFTKNGLLIFIYAPGQLDKAALASYITSLTP